MTTPGRLMGVLTGRAGAGSVPDEPGTPSSSGEGSVTGAALRRSVPAVVLAVLVLSPFLDKAFTIDDTVFLREAQHALTDPLHPTAFEMVWNEVSERVAPTSGPLMAWLLMPAVAMRDSERIAHLVQLLMVAVTAFATVALALRIGLAPASATAAGVLVVATPAVLGMAGTAMADVPAMALGVAGIERLVAWKQERRLHQAVLAAVLLALAPLGRSHLVLVLGIGALLVVGEPWRPSRWRAIPWKTWVPLAVAPSLTAAVMLLTRDPAAASGLVGTTLRVGSSAQLAPNTVAFLTHWVLVFPLAIPWALLRPEAILRRWWALFLGTTISAALFAVASDAPLWYSPIPGLGFAVLLDVFADGWKRRDGVQVSLGLWLLVALAGVPYFHVPSKYLLASAPAAALLVAREAAAHGRTHARVVLGLATVLGLGLGIAILRADASFAGLARRAVAELVQPNVAAGRRVWFTPHWGFQWYAEQAGARIVTLDPPYPDRGDLLVTSVKTDQAASVRILIASRYGPTLRHLARVEDRTPGGRLMHDGAGFFSNDWGYLPWVWSDKLNDAFDLWVLE